ncbi:alkanesulfonate transporter substrate-binding subunit [Pseudomonas syringae pv. japonica str. M301072]|uniref:Alkanesulfonate transporter substrate-binding subunit n=1 Tax=Pseudomonas syringae pv. japonica str. M301072 TaxID=629262 RepID=F3FV70_PSESX|nr:alkanesulfonate transporter substrate-binding subunit [Pseudomonas syringae pv. japonica str. M301072]
MLMPKKRPVIITCAVTGAIHTPSMSPHLPITPEIVRAQQATADLFYDNHLIPKRVDIQQVVWQKP